MNKNESLWASGGRRLLRTVPQWSPRQVWGGDRVGVSSSVRLRPWRGFPSLRTQRPSGPQEKLDLRKSCDQQEEEEVVC